MNSMLEDIVEAMLLNQTALGVQLCLRRFFPKFEALFLKSDYLFMTKSTVHR